jgi:hypothetical protein
LLTWAAVAVNVDLRALRTSHATHRARSEGLPRDASANLLLFYAVECGLKAALIRECGLRGTAQLDAHLRNHDLRKLARELRMAPVLVSRLQDCRRKHDGSHVPLHDLHEAWRYGAALEPIGESAATAALVAVSDWCRARLAM